MTGEIMELKVKMIHLLDQKEKVATRHGEINRLRGWPPGWFSWTYKLVNSVKTGTDMDKFLYMKMHTHKNMGK